MKVYVTGHKNPDTDSIVSAIAYAHLLKEKGEDAVAARLDEVNDETRFVLKEFGAKKPRLIKSGKGKNLILVDHNEVRQTIDDVDEAKIIEIIDHHRVGNVETVEPIDFEIKVIGSTSTIIAERFFEERIPIPKRIAGLLISGILSDTLLLKSPTTKKQDVKIVKSLSALAELNYEEYGARMLKAGTKLLDKSGEKILRTDMKVYEKNGVKAAISQVPVVDEEDIDSVRSKVRESLEESCDDNDYFVHLVMFTYVYKGGTELMGCGPGLGGVEEALGKEFENGLMFLEDVVSRKKQVQPHVMRLIQKS